MTDRNLVRGLVLIGIALAFGLRALAYPIGGLSHAGPGLFPLIVSALLLLIGAITVVRSTFVAHVALDFRLKNMALILASLCGFALASRFVNMSVGIVFMVFCAGIAGTSNSWSRNAKISVVLIVIGFGFRKLLGLNLPLY